MIDWLLKHPQVAIIVVVMISAVFKRAKGAVAADKDDAEPATRGEFQANTEAAEDAERARRVQEEIRRKIAERSGGQAPPVIPGSNFERPVASPVAAPRPVAQPAGMTLYDRLQAKLAEVRRREEEAAAKARARNSAEERSAREADERAAQQAVTERAALKANTAAAEIKATALAAASVRTLREDLRTSANLRRAMVLREILGPPVALR